MNGLCKFSVLAGVSLLCACSPVKIPVTHQYQLTEYNQQFRASSPTHATLWVTVPEAVAGYQTEQMVYINKPFQLESFVKNAWTSTPAEMLFPLMVQSLQKSHYFYAVMSSTYSLGADYRLDTQILSLRQNFLHRPSQLEFSAKIVLTRIKDNKVLGSQIVDENIRCNADTPYAGVQAANQAMVQFTAKTAAFIREKLTVHRH